MMVELSASRDPGACVAVTDIGTNTVMTLVLRPTSRGLVYDAEWVATTRLGEGLRSNRRLSEAACERTLTALRTQRSLLEKRQAHGVALCVATSAVRDAVNAEPFLRACAEILGGDPVVLSGAEEARWTFRGASSDVRAETMVLEVDIGGGSTEISCGRAGADCDVAESVDVGCLRVTERFALHEPAPPARVKQARRYVREMLAPCFRILSAAPVSIGIEQLVCTGGSATTYAAMMRRLTVFERQKIHGFHGDRASLASTLDHLLSLDCAGRSRLPGVPADRAGVLPAGLLILDEILRELEMAEFRVSIRGLRYGLALGLATAECPAIRSW